MALLQILLHFLHECVRKLLFRPLFSPFFLPTTTSSNRLKINVSCCIFYTGASWDRFSRFECTEEKNYTSLGRLIRCLLVSSHCDIHTDKICSYKKRVHYYWMDSIFFFFFTLVSCCTVRIIKKRGNARKSCM